MEKEGTRETMKNRVGQASCLSGNFDRLEACPTRKRGEKSELISEFSVFSVADLLRPAGDIHAH